jgi:hypothetical protein
MKIQIQELQTASWTLTEEQQLLVINLGTKKNPQTIKVNVQSIEERLNFLKKLLLEYKDVFAWIYKDLKGIPLELAQHHIELDTSIPPAH